LGYGKGIRKKSFNGVYHSSFRNPRRASEGDLLNFLATNHNDLKKIFHSSTLTQTLYRFFRSKMSAKIGRRTFIRLSKLFCKVSPKELETVDAACCYLTVVNCLAHRAKDSGLSIRKSLLRKKNEVIVHLLMNMPDYFEVERDPLLKDNFQFLIIRRKSNPDEAFHFPRRIIDSLGLTRSIKSPFSKD